MFDPQKAIKDIDELSDTVRESGIVMDYVMKDYVPPWWQMRLPFYIDISLNIGSTMFDFCFWKLPEVLSVGAFWIHFDIQAGGRR